MTKTKQKPTFDELMSALEADIVQRITEELRDDGFLMLYTSDMKIGFHHELEGGVEILSTSTITQLVSDALENGWEDPQMRLLIDDLRSALRMAEEDYEKHKAGTDSHPENPDPRAETPSA